MTPNAPKVLKQPSSLQPSSLQPSPLQPSPLQPSPLQGGFVARLGGAKLSGARLVDLIQAECLRGTRVVVRVRSDRARGLLYFDEGQLVHAICGSLVGENAVFEMLRWLDSSFEACEASWPGQNSISVGWQYLLIEAMRRCDEADRESEPASEERTSQEMEVHPQTAPLAEATGARFGGKAVTMAAVKQGTEAKKHGVLRAVRFEEDGQIISHHGQVGDLADISAYALRLARILGETLEVGSFVGLESRVDDKSLFLFLDEGTIVAVEASSESSASYRRKAGF
jgi:hypothetical protein